MACGPNLRVWKYNGCIVNGVRFLAKDRDNRTRSQNSGITCEGEHNDKVIDFYGLLNKVIKIEYGEGFNVYLFLCEWYDLGKRRTIIKETHFTSVNVSGRWYKNDPYILASQAKQVFYLDDLKLGHNWKIVQRFNHRHVFDVPEDETDEEFKVQVENIVHLDDEPFDIHVVDDHDIGPLSRNDIIPDTIGSDAIANSGISRSPDEDGMIELDGDTDDDVDQEEDSEDDTLLEYCSDEERDSNNDEDSDDD